MAASFPYAREEDGTAAPFVRDARFCHRCAAMILGLLLLALVNGIAGLMIFAVGWIACRLFGFWSYKRIGGVTGDVLGACSELIETIILFLCAMLEKKIMGFHL
jgi:adenosylcobinamide-GDP ribazoletransferase